MDNKKIAVFIDAGNMWSSYKELGRLLNFKKISDFFSGKFGGRMFKMFYYEAYPKSGTRDKRDIDNLHKFFTFLKKGLGFSVVKKELKTIYLRDKEGNIIFDASGEPKSHEKGNFDVEITMDVLRYSTAYDVAVFLTGDSDFLPLISYLRTKNQPKEVYIFSTKGCVSSELKTGSDGFFDLHDFPEIFGNELIRKTRKQ